MMMKLSTLMMSSVLAFGTSALAQRNDPADASGPGESRSSIANPLARPGSDEDRDVAAWPARAASANPAPEAVPADPRDDRTNRSDIVDDGTRNGRNTGPASDAAAGVVPYEPVDPETGKTNDLYSGA